MTQNPLPLADELARLAARMSPMLLSGATVTSAVEVVTALARDTVPAATGAGASLIDEQGRRMSTGATSLLVLEADDAQYRLDEGPCLTAWVERRPVRVDDIAQDGRWPRWSAAVEPLSLRSSLSAPLLVAGRVLGAVKVYSDRPAAFDEWAEHLLTAFAETAALLLANADSSDDAVSLSEDFRQALRDRDQVQLATGMVMQRDRLTREAAFQVLVAAVDATHPLCEVAAHVVESGTHRSSTDRSSTGLSSTGPS